MHNQPSCWLWLRISPLEEGVLHGLKSGALGFCQAFQPHWLHVTLVIWQDDEVVLQCVASIQKENRKFCLTAEGLGNRLCYLEPTSEAKVGTHKWGLTGVWQNNKCLLTQIANPVCVWFIVRLLQFTVHTKAWALPRVTKPWCKVREEAFEGIFFKLQLNVLLYQYNRVHYFSIKLIHIKQQL